MKILITGANGQLGRALQNRFHTHEILALTHADLDVGEHADVLSLANQSFDLIIHAAAMTNVDGCEHNPQRAYRTNALGTQNIALLAQQSGAVMLYVSTDYVYDGQKGRPYWEWDPTNPLSVYADSKLAGEWYVKNLLTKFYITRTAWVYGPNGNNFARKILALSQKYPKLSVVTTETGHPTYAPHLADAIYRLVGTGAFGLYHLVNEGCISRYEFACAILKAAGKANYPIEATDFYPRAATPPAHVELSTFAAEQVGASLPSWQEGLQAWIKAEGLS